ncbi:MFS transporter [Aggregatilinea lenta]|uniref:MFS transporter n=1 Tax=Aggregatilinea lenta TaxID=913108 RepID=UPI000E5ABFE2|nr:MFS transporter [Aggregatilinea lenta]
MFASHITRRDAYRIYLIMEGATAFFLGLIFTVNMVYQVTVVDLNPLQLVLVGTTLEAVIFLFEVPTGIVADVYSRRLSVLIGLALIGAGFALEGLVPAFGAVLAAQVLWGLGATFTSGATQAWIADEIGEDRAGAAFLRAAQVGAVAGLVAIPISVALASLNVRIPIVLGGALFVVLAGGLSLVMPEDGFTPAPRVTRSPWGPMRQTLRDSLHLIRARGVLLTFLAISAVLGLYSEGFDRLWTAHFLGDFTLPALGSLKPVVWFGIIGAVGSLLSIGTTELARRRGSIETPQAMARALIGLTLGTVGAILVFALAGRFGLALGAYWIASALRSTSEPIFNAWLNRSVESSVRATVFSAVGQVNAIGQIAGGPWIGWIGTAWSLRAALSISGLMLTPAALLFARGARQSADAGPDGRALPDVPVLVSIEETV